MANPFDHANNAAESERNFVALDLATVVETVENSESDIRVRPLPTKDEDEGPFVAKMVVDSYGDIDQPAVGDMVVIGYTRVDEPVVLGMWYGGDIEEAPDHDIDERVIGNRFSDSTVRFKADGSVVVETTSTTVEVTDDGDVIVNDGTTGVVTDVDFVSETVTRSDSLFVP